MIDRAFFVDTWAYRALADRRDPAHDAAARRMRSLIDDGNLPITSNYVLAEAYTGIRLRAGVRAAIAFGEDIRSLANRSAVHLEWVDEGRERAAWSLFRRYTQLRDLSFTDCTSFAIMRELGVERVLTADVHFREGEPRLRAGVTVAGGASSDTTYGVEHGQDVPTGVHAHE